MAIPKLSSAAGALLALAIAGGCSSSAAPDTSASAVRTDATAAAGSVPAPAPGGEPWGSSAAEIVDRWGVEVVGLRRTAAGYMLDFRYRVLDPDKAAPLFARSDKPVVVHHATGARLPVHNPAKTGPLRPTNAPEAGRVYFIMFANARGVAKAGDEVTIEIGEFSADVVVEE